MKYSKIFFLFFLLISNTQTNFSQTNQFESIVEKWIHEHFTNKMYEDLAYSEELFMNLKQYLFDKNYTDEIAHKDLKNIVKENIKKIKQKKQRSQKWFDQNKKELTVVIKNYFKNNKTNDKWGIYQYLNTSSDKTCKKLQEAMHNKEMLPAYINQSIKLLIKQAQL